MSDVVERLNAALGGRYEIERELGEGGMAVVYLAKDLKHKRNVALKVLKPELAAVVGAERFLGEIETTAGLQHPHILPLFDSGEAGGFLFYVMPYIEGETLRDRIDREKQLPVDEALGIATAVAGALQTAHDAGIVHRDIKPGNILLSRGQPLVADFGIALAVGAAGGSRLTETGLSVGTPYYMSPEQATGDQTLGPASDTYALACVLYEMLVGEPPYLGNTAQAVLGKIIQGVPVSVTAVRKAVPSNVDAAIRKALEKLPADRFTRADGFARALADPGFRHGEPAGVGGGGGSPWNRLSMGFAGVAAVLALALGWSALAPEPPASLQPVKRFEIPLGPTTSLTPADVHSYEVLSPDGTQLVYGVSPDGQPARLYVRPVDQLEARELPGTAGAIAPFFSPDGQWVGFFVPTQGRLMKVSIQGGQPLDLAPAYPPMGATWLEDGTIIFITQEPGSISVGSRGTGAALFRVPDAGGTPERLTTVDAERGEAYHGFPHALPGDKAIIFTRTGTLGGEGRIVALSLETGEEHALVDVGYDGRYSPTGHLIFARQGALWAVPFDAETLETTGQEVVVLQGLEMSPYAVSITFSPDGLMAYMPGEAALTGTAVPTIARSLVWVDREGREEALPLPTRQYSDPRLSPDGGLVAVAVFDGQSWDLWVYDVQSGRGLRLTHVEPPGSSTMVPIWTPDGERIIYRALDTSTNIGDLYWIAADGTGTPEAVVSDPENSEYSTSVTADGRTLIYANIMDPGNNGHREIWTVPLEGEHTPAPLLRGNFAYGNAALSPDGRWLAYFSNESGDYEIYIQPYPGPGPVTPVSRGGGEQVVWSPDGSELYYRSGAMIMAVDIREEPSLSVGEPREIFTSSHYTVTGGGSRQLDVAPDGRFLMIRQGDADVDGSAQVFDHLVIVENWLDELRRLSPVE